MSDWIVIAVVFEMLQQSASIVGGPRWNEYWIEQCFLIL